MKLSFLIITVSVITVFGFSCGHSNQKAMPLSLDNGSKWTANTETTTGINSMIRLLDEFAGTDDMQAYKILMANLSEQYQLIFKKCTMKGEAHNQLHNYLLPMKDLFNGLESNDLKVRKENLKKLKAYLLSYPDYFQ